MYDIEIIEVDKNSLYLDHVEHLFAELYDHMNTAGLMMPLVVGGEKLWRKSLEKTIGGRFGILVIAVKNDNVIGFAQGVVRFSHSYLGGQQVGFIPHIYIRPAFQNMGIGKKLVSKLEAWFKKTNVRSYELQVLPNNKQAIAFWKSIGMKKELLQMRKTIR